MAATPKPERKKVKEFVGKIREHVKPVKEKGGAGHMKAKRAIKIAEMGAKRFSKKT